jgi:hypothetical protein
MPEPLVREETMAPYKTIVLELLQEQYPGLHERLRRKRKLLETLNRHASELRTAHLAWTDELRRTSAEADPAHISSEALDLAIEHLQGSLACESPPTGEADETFSLDAAMASFRQATPPA